MKTVPVVAEAETESESETETSPAEARSWNSRPTEIAGQPVDAAAIRALAADPAAPPELMVRAVAEETPEQIAQRKALEKRHPVLGVRLGEAKRNMGPIYPDDRLCPPVAGQRIFRPGGGDAQARRGRESRRGLTASGGW